MLFVFDAPIFGNLRCRPAALGAAILAGFVLSQTVQGATSDLVDLRPGSQAGGYRQCKVVVEVEGKLKLNADGKEVTHLPVKAKAELEYAERVLSQAKQWSEVRLARSYRAADAKIRLRETDIDNRLRDARRLIVVESTAKQALLFSPQGTLTREELELIETPASGLAPEALLPPRVLKIGGQWPLEDATVARLLGLEAVSQQNVACTLESVKDKENLAIVDGNAVSLDGWARTRRLP
jgi:hypothetical protein